MTILLVTKIKQNGQPCAKSARVLDDLSKRQLMDRIHHVIHADERDPQSQGYALAAEYQVDAAPFFLVKKGALTQVYRAYHQFLHQMFGQDSSDIDAATEIMAQNPDLDFI